MATKTLRPVRTLVIFFVTVVLLFGAAALGGTWKPQLGLDLEGGTRITLQAEGRPNQTNMNLARSIIEQRANGSGVTEAATRIQAGTNIVVEIPGENARSIVESVQRTAQLRFRLVAGYLPAEGAAPSASPSGSPSGSPSENPNGGTVGTPSGSPSGATSANPSGSPSGSPSATASGNNRPGALGADDPSPSESASGSPSPSPSKKADAKKDGPYTVEQGLQFVASPPQGALAKFQAYQCPTGDKAQEPVDDVPSKALITCDDDGNKYLLSPALIEGTELRTASYGTPPQGVGWAVQLSFKSSARDTFADVTKALNANDGQFAIVLDGRVISAAGVTSPILDGNAEITGSFTEGEARSLSNSLKFGALPVKFQEPSVETIGPSLAGDQLRAGIIAGIIGLVVVMIYCMFYYRGLGLVVLASLVVAAGITYATVLVLAKTASFTLTLPGIAGLIVAVGITADSFIVYFERIRDEMRTGKSMRVAVELGWARARNTCLAADAVSLLAAVVLYIFTIGVVKGFAFALGISTIIDLAVFFWFTKPMMTVLAKRTFFNSGGKWSGLSDETLGIDGPPAGSPRAPATVGGKA